MAYFNPVRNIYGYPEVYDDVIIANSETITTGGFVTLIGGFAEATAAGEPIYGLVVGFVGTKDANKGLPLDKLTAAVDYDGTYTAGAFGTNAYVATSDNQTDKQIAARVRIDVGLAMANTPDAAIGTTSGSNLKGNYTDIASSTQVDENNATNAFTTKAQLTILGIGGQLGYEEIATSQGIYMICEKQELGH